MTSCQPNSQGSGETIQKGSLVEINYTLKVDGNVVDSSEGKKPLAFTHESGQLIPGFESALEGMAVGAQKSFQVPPEKGYGPVNPQAVQEIPKKSIQNSDQLQVGQMVSGQNGGQPVQAKVVGITKDSVKLDFNHPLAGKNLNFDVSVVSVSQAPKN